MISYWWIILAMATTIGSKKKVDLEHQLHKVFGYTTKIKNNDINRNFLCDDRIIHCL
jgi:hypothetical protein